MTMFAMPASIKNAMSTANETINIKLEPETINILLRFFETLAKALDEPDFKDGATVPIKETDLITASDMLKAHNRQSCEAVALTMPVEDWYTFAWAVSYARSVTTHPDDASVLKALDDQNKMIRPSSSIAKHSMPRKTSKRISP